jgi:hypothetical protein
MDLERIKDLSVYYFMKDLFNTTDYINVVDGFPVENLVIPCVSVESNTIDTKPGELGNRRRILIRSWYIDVFAKNKSQRDEIGYKILRALEDPIQVYNYDEGFPPDVSPTRIGCMNIDEIQMRTIKIMPQLVDRMYYRTTVNFTAEYNQI